VTKRTTKKTDGGIVCKQTLINAKLQIGKRGQKTELTGRSQLQRQKRLQYTVMPLKKKKKKNNK